jgi:hypothetical protein
MNATEMELGKIYAFRYVDEDYRVPLKVVTVKSMSYNVITGWCHEEKTQLEFLPEDIFNIIPVCCDTESSDSSPINIDSTVYMIHEGDITEFSVDQIILNGSGHLYTLLAKGAGTLVEVEDHEKLYTTKIACANAWLRNQGLEEITKASYEEPKDFVDL